MKFRLEADDGLRAGDFDSREAAENQRMRQTKPDLWFVMPIQPTPAWSETVDWGQIPERMRGGIIRYVEHGIKPGSFLYAVICNDLMAAVRNADDENIKLLPAYARLIYQYFPPGISGSEERVKLWIAQNRKDLSA